MAGRQARCTCGHTFAIPAAQEVVDLNDSHVSARKPKSLPDGVNRPIDKKLALAAGAMRIVGALCFLQAVAGCLTNVLAKATGSSGDYPGHEIMMMTATVGVISIGLGEWMRRPNHT